MQKKSAKLYQILSFSLASTLSFQLSANNDAAFTQYLSELCLAPSGVLIATCTSAFPVIGGGGSETHPTTVNAGQQNANGNRSTNTTIQGDSSLTEIRFKNWGLFSSFQYTDTKKDNSDLESGFKGDSRTFLAGADYRLNNHTLIGFAASIGDTAIDFDDNSGALDSSHNEFIGFFDHQFNDALYIHGYSGFTDKTNDAKRQVDFGEINYIAESDFDEDQTQWGLAVGYLINLKKISLDTTLAFNQRRTEIESYEETGGTTVDNLNLIYESQSVDSQTISLGFVSSLNVSTTNGIFIPFLRIEITKENKNDAREIASRLASAAPNTNFTLATEAPDRDFITAGGGVKLVATKGIQCYLDTDWMVAHEYLHTWRISAGLRIEI